MGKAPTAQQMHAMRGGARDLQGATGWDQPFDLRAGRGASDALPLSRERGGGNSGHLGERAP